MTKIAAFDLDKTLTDRDCLLRFFWFLWRRGEHLNFRAASKTAIASRTSVKLALCKLLRGQSISHLDDCATEFFEHHARYWFRTDTVNALRKHHNNGDTVVIVSASLSLYVAKFADFLGVDYLATDLKEVAGVLTGELNGENVRGPEKVLKLEQWLSSKDLQRPDVHLTAYGDSSGDQQLLDWADHSVWVK